VWDFQFAGALFFSASDGSGWKRRSGGFKKNSVWLADLGRKWPGSNWNGEAFSPKCLAIHVNCRCPVWLGSNVKFHDLAGLFHWLNFPSGAAKATPQSP
jgi:hypothetical protein